MLSPQCIDIVFSAYLMFSDTGCYLYHKSSMQSQCFDQAIMEGVARASDATSASGGIHGCCEVPGGAIFVLKARNTKMEFAKNWISQTLARRENLGFGCLLLDLRCLS